MTPVPSSSRASSLGSSSRLHAVDIARAVAIWSMFVAHTAPSGGPLRLLNLSEYLTAPLFAALVGVGAALSHQRQHTRGNRYLAAALRGGVLIVLGVLLSSAGAQIVIVLIHLGALTILIVPVAAMATWGVTVTAAAAFVLSPLLMTWGRAFSTRLHMDGSPAGEALTPLVSLFLSGYSYRVSAFLFWACVGILLTRLLMGAAHQSAGASRSPRSTAVTGATAGCAALVTAALFVVHKSGAFALAPYSGTHAELLFNAFMLTAVIATCLALTPLAPAVLVHGTAAVGQMALTHYCLQILALGAWVRWVSPSDDSWAVMTGLIVGSCIITAVWRYLVRKPPWQRGIVEGLSDTLVGLTRKPHSAEVGAS